MARTGARRRRVIALIAALSINAGLLALMAPKGRDSVSPSGDTGPVLRVDLMRKSQARAAMAPTKRPAVEPSTPRRLSPQGSRVASAQGRPSTAPAQAPPPALPPAHLAQAARPGVAPADSSGGADLRAKTALALRRLGACSRVNSGAGDAQDRELCSARFTSARGPSLEAIPDDKRAGYDAAHARAGYLVPADAADPDFGVSEFKRGNVVVKGHAGCTLEGGKWTCVGH